MKEVLEFKFEFKKYHEVYEALIKMKDIIDEYGQVRVADIKELCGQNSAYTDNYYGWKELRNYFIVYEEASRNYVLYLNQPERLKKCKDNIDALIAGFKSQIDWWHDYAMENVKKLDKTEIELFETKKELEETKNRLKESNDKLTRISNDMARLCTLMDGFGEMLNDQFIVHCANRKHKDFIYETVFKYSDLKN